MNINRPLSAIVAALFVTATMAFTLVPVLGAASQVSVSPELVRACAGAEQNVKGSPTCATSLETALNANNADLMALRMAARSQDKAAPKMILMKYGLTAPQLEGAAIVLKDESSGAKALRVTITITCCPLTITIVFKKK